MKGYIIQADLYNYINWQGLLVNDRDHAAIFSSENDAKIVRNYLCKEGSIIPHERNDAGPGQLGTYYELHRNT